MEDNRRIIRKDEGEDYKIKLTSFKQIKVAMIEKRLALLDQADNDYFKIPYGAYAYEEWGHGI